MVEIDDVINAIKICGSKKILFGSDVAIFGEKSYKRYNCFQDRLLNSFSRIDLEILFCNNAKRIFKL